MRDRSSSSPQCFSKRQACACLFALKATIAFGLATCLLALQARRVWALHSLALRPLFPITPACRYLGPRKRLDPGHSKFLLGFSLGFLILIPDWQIDTPQQLVDRLKPTQSHPQIFNTFIKLTAKSIQHDIIKWNCQLASKTSSMLEITADPAQDIQSIPSSIYLLLARAMRECNSIYGVPVLLRFGHEMNGGWMTFYGNQPSNYIQAFVTLSTYVHSLTNMTAMLWSPNTGQGYPFSYASQPNFPKINDPDPVKREDFRRMDTNNDGLISSLDDPYGPYYPGDEYVDVSKEKCINEK